MIGQSPDTRDRDIVTKQDGEAGEYKEGNEEKKVSNDIGHGKLPQYLRQHGKYLTPGEGIDIFSLIAVILRGSILSVLVYLSLLVLAMYALKNFQFFRILSLRSWGLSTELSVPFLIAMGAIGLYLLFTILYSPLTFFFSRPRGEKNTRHFLRTGNLTKK